MRDCAQNGRRIEVGVCLKLSELDQLDLLTPDYIELPFAEIAQLPEDLFRSLQMQLQTTGVRVPVMTQLMPKKARVVDGDNAFSQYKEYLEQGFERAGKLGAEIVIFGNAGARNILKTLRREDASKRLVAFLKTTAKMAAGCGISVCIEPLNRIQSNFINSVDEASLMAFESGEQNVGIVWDYFHFQVEKDEWDSIERNWKYIFHCHTAALLRRGIPDPLEQKQFLQVLRDHGYTGRISLEFDALPSNAMKITKSVEEFKKCLCYE